MISSPLHIAVLGDLHGHLTLAYSLLRRWEAEFGQTLDLILQVGDLGAFPPPFRLDPATERFAEEDPDELGFSRYFQPSAEADDFFGPDSPRPLGGDTLFIRGNHEDLEFLHEQAAGARRPVAVDHYGKILYLPNGATYTFTKGEHAVTIGALGGLSGRDHGPGIGPEHYAASDVRRPFAAGATVDVLLSHEPPYEACAAVHPKYASSGSRGVRELLAVFGPRYHFCGHYHEPGQELPAPGVTRSFILNAVGFLRASRLNPGCIGLLTWMGHEAVAFRILDEPWLSEHTRQDRP